MSRRKRVLLGAGLLVVLASCLFSPIALYGAIFWAWVTATPLTPAQLSRAQYNAYVWFGAFALSSAASFALSIACLRSYRRSH